MTPACMPRWHAQVLVYHFADLRLMHSIETLSNPGGLLALSAAPDHTVLACPGLHAGQVRDGGEREERGESEGERLRQALSSSSN